jgi:hypothetical protein
MMREWGISTLSVSIMKSSSINQPILVYRRQTETALEMGLITLSTIPTRYIAMTDSVVEPRRTAP